MLIGNVHRTPKLSKYECSWGSPEVLLQLSVKRIKSLEPQIWERRITIGWISWSNLETRSKSAVETLPSPLECQRTGSWRTESSTRRCPREASSRRWGFGGWCWRCKPVYTTNTTEKSGTTMLRKREYANRNSISAMNWTNSRENIKRGRTYVVTKYPLWTS